MKIKKEKSQKRITSIHVNKIGFWRANWALLVLIVLAVIVVFALGYVALSPYKNKKSIEEDIASMETTNLIFIDKIVCYSSAYGLNNSETQARWNLNLSQYTDIAVYLNVQTSVASMYIDNISFANSDTGSLSLSYLATEDFGKSPVTEIESATQDTDEDTAVTGNVNTIEEAETTTSNISEASDRIELSLTLPITLRYLNSNLKESCLITDIETPLTFDGSILKRGKVTLSSIKNTVSFNLHIVDGSNQEYIYPISITLEFENSETGKSIYDGSYTQEISFSNAYI